MQSIDLNVQSDATAFYQRPLRISFLQSTKLMRLSQLYIFHQKKSSSCQRKKYYYYLFIYFKLSCLSFVLLLSSRIFLISWDSGGKGLSLLGKQLTKLLTRKEETRQGSSHPCSFIQRC